MNDVFHTVAKRTSDVVGSPWTFVLALVVLFLWALSGNFFDYSDTWQLIINTGTTIVTFLMVFLIQNTQNRDARAIHIKLDELLRGVKGARTGLVSIENLNDEELAQLTEEFRTLHERYAGEIHKRRTRRSKARSKVTR